MGTAVRVVCYLIFSIGLITLLTFTYTQNTFQLMLALGLIFSSGILLAVQGKR